MSNLSWNCYEGEERKLEREEKNEHPSLHLEYGDSEELNLGVRGEAEFEQASSASLCACDGGRHCYCHHAQL